MRSVQIGEVQV